MKLTDSDSTKKYLNGIKAIYESIRFDLQKTIDFKKEDFEKLFPEMELDFSTYESIVSNLLCLMMQLKDMWHYCLRLL